jgi:hypothetical protein
VYCKFWELDSDHDFSLDRSDLARYANCALTYQIVERIFEEVRVNGLRVKSCASWYCSACVCGSTFGKPTYQIVERIFEEVGLCGRALGF